VYQFKKFLLFRNSLKYSKKNFPDLPTALRMLGHILKYAMDIRVLNALIKK